MVSLVEDLVMVSLVEGLVMVPRIEETFTEMFLWLKWFIMIF